MSQLSPGIAVSLSMMMSLLAAGMIYLALWLDQNPVYCMIGAALTLGGAVCIWPHKDPTGFMSEMSGSNH